jgi:hypothetical protein
MAQLMLINPKKRSAARARKAPRSAAQKAATKRMLAANRAKRGPHKSNYTKRKAANTVARYFPNPVRRIKRRRNPIGRASLAGVTGMMMPAVQGAFGALAINTALNYVPLPAILKSGNAKYLARAGLAVAVGVFGSKIVGGKMAANMATGALTVAMHDLLLGIASAAMPTLQLGDVGDYDDGVSDYDEGVSAYEEGDAIAGYIPNGMSGADVDVYDTSGGVSEFIAV